MKKVALMVVLGFFLCIPIHTDAKEVYELSTEIEQYCEYYGSQYGISPELLESIIWTESRGQKYVKNSSCIGISQINVESQSDRLERSMNVTGIYDQYDYRVQIRTMCSLIYDLSYGEYAEEQQDIALTLAQYHGESDAIATYDSGQMSDYVESILKLARELEIKHQKVEVME